MITSPSREESLAVLMGCKLHDMIIQIDAYGKPYFGSFCSSVSWEGGWRWFDVLHCLSITKNGFHECCTIRSHALAT